MKCFVGVELAMPVSLGVGWSLDLLDFGARSDFENYFWGLVFAKIHENFSQKKFFFSLKN